MSKVVRSSKYRHVFGQPAKRDKTYDTLKVSRRNGDTNGAAASANHIAVCWESGGGGAFAVIPHERTGRQLNCPLFTGHKGPVLDLAFNPFNESLIASASDDCTVKLWSVPEEQKDHVSEALQTLDGHQKKVSGIKFNPVANNVLASMSMDKTVRIWDIESGEAKATVEGYGGLIQCADWNATGDQLVTTSKDKKVRIIDGRTGEVAVEAGGMEGAKGSNCVWMKRKDKLFLAGFTRNAERAFRVMDPRNMSEPLTEQEIDTSNGILMPFYDEDTDVMFLAGKGDGNIRYYEMVDEKPYAHFLSAYKSSTPQKGMCALPKLAVNVRDCEIMRLFKVTDNAIEPISMIVPRKSDAFQDDIYVDSWLNEPVVQAEEYFAGKTGERKTVSMKDIFDGKFTVGKQQAASFTKKATPLEAAREENAALKKENAELKDKVKDLEAQLAKLQA